MGTLGRSQCRRASQTHRNRKKARSGNGGNESPADPFCLLEMGLETRCRCCRGWPPSGSRVLAGSEELPPHERGPRAPEQVSAVPRKEGTKGTLRSRVAAAGSPTKRKSAHRERPQRQRTGKGGQQRHVQALTRRIETAARPRSEERRVGKECRSLW